MAAASDPAGGPGRATLAGIAEQAGVSIASVSKVLNGRDGVSAATRERVEELLQEQGYARRNTPQAAAPLVEFVFSAIDSEWAFELIIGAERVARANGLSVVLTESGDRQGPGPEWITAVINRRPAGVVLVFGNLLDEQKAVLHTRRIPFVIVDPSGDPPDDVPSIGSTNWAGGYSAGRHLVDLGHRRIAAITGPEDQLSSTARVSGFRAALESAGVPLPAELVRESTFLYEDGLTAARELLRLPSRPSAIFAGNDQQALGTYEAARELGIRIPEELSIVGYDDLRLARWVGPPLTTVRQPLQEMAKQATELVLRMREQALVGTMRVELATSLIERGSTAPPVETGTARTTTPARRP